MHLASTADAAENADEMASREHFMTVMRLAASDPAHAVRQTLEGLELAREILEAGDSQSVLAYLDLVEVFWVTAPKNSGSPGSTRLGDKHAAKLKQWREEIRAGKIPANW